MKNDRFLLFLLIGIGVLVLLAVGLYLARGGVQMTYGEESTPEGVLRNYIIAVQKQDFERAYGYLSDTTKGKPARAAFQQTLIASQNEMLRTGVDLGQAQFADDATAVIPVTLIHNADGLFNTPYRDVQSVTLLLENGKWKVTNLPYPFGDWNWFGGYNEKMIEPAPVPEN